MNPLTISYLHLRNWNIFEQLQLEEGLLRADDRNFFILSEGSATPSIVMGISGKVEQLVDLTKTTFLEIPLIRRFSGGGTVIVDEGTLFVTFIGNRDLIEPRNYTPESIMRWAEEVLHPAFAPAAFHLKENDFAIKEKKCGGNAQYLQKKRFLIHTSFLWTYQKERMSLLLHPPKMPLYRQDRNHDEFLCPLEGLYPSKDHLITRISEEIKNKFVIQPANLDELQSKLSLSTHRQSTRLEGVPKNQKK
jgi:lipoate---protein ligase